MAKFKKSHTVDDQLVIDYVWSKILGVQEEYQLSWAKMASIAGYERTSWHRIMRSGMPNLLAIHALSVYFGRGMDFWFPPIVPNLEQSVLPLRKGCVCEGAAPFSVQILTVLRPLSAEAKGRILKALKATYPPKQTAGP